MSSGVAVALIVFLGTTLTAFIIAHLLRKQMRQIEMHRRDKSVPLEPPISAGTVVFLRSLPYIIFSGELIYAGFKLLRDFQETTPITRSDIADISWNIAFMWATGSMMITLFLFNRLNDVIINTNSSSKIE